MGLLRFLKHLFSREHVRKHAPPEQVSAKAEAEDLGYVFRKSIPPSAEAEPVAVTIGLDFGTSTTKCIVNVEGKDSSTDRYIAIAFPNENSDAGTLCVPTAIGVDDHTLLFGFDAEHLSEDKVICSFKMAIPCIDGQWGQYEGPFMLRNKPGYFGICGHELSALDLSCLYLSTIIRQARLQLAGLIGGNRDLKVHVNLAAPLDHLFEYYKYAETAPEELRKKMHLDNQVRDTRISKSYWELGQWSLRLSKQSFNSLSVDKALSALSEVKAAELLPKEETPAYVIPEALAAITSYVKRPRTRSGKYMTFDVGAGTTDVSVFWLEKHDWIVKPYFYATGSLHSGMDDIDRSLSDLLNGIVDHSLRRRREVLVEDSGGLKEFKGNRKMEDVLEAIKGHKNHMFGLGYKIEPRQRRWGNPTEANIPILMLGGGCLTDVIRELCEESLWYHFVGPPTDVKTLELYLTEKVLLPDCREVPLSDMESLAGQARLLIIAEGLASKSIDIPPYDFTLRPLFVNPVYDGPNYDWWRS